MANSADPDELASSDANWSGVLNLHCLKRQDIPEFSRTRVKCCMLKVIGKGYNIREAALSKLFCLRYEKAATLKAKKHTASYKVLKRMMETLPSESSTLTCIYRSGWIFLHLVIFISLCKWYVSWIRRNVAQFVFEREAPELPETCQVSMTWNMTEILWEFATILK